MHEGTYQKEQRTLWLVEVGYHHLNDVELVAWSNDYLCAAMQDIKVMLLHISLQGLKGLES